MRWILIIVLSSSIARAVSYPYPLVGFQYDSVASFVSENTISVVHHGGGGTCIAASNENAHVFRSVDSGAHWTDLGAIDSGRSTDIVAICHIGGNKWVLGTFPNGHLWLSGDDGVTWIDKGILVSGENQITSFIHLGSGLVIAGTNPHAHLVVTNDYFNTYTDRGAMFSEKYIASFLKVNDTLLIAGTSPHSLLLRSPDNGKTWDNTLGSLAEENLNSLQYLPGRKRIIAAVSQPARVFKSDDFGAKWTEVALNLTTLGESSANAVAVYGNDIVNVSTWPAAQLWRSDDGGDSWESRGRHFNQVDFYCLIHIGNGVFLGGCSNLGMILRSEPFTENIRRIGPWNRESTAVKIPFAAWSKGNGTTEKTSGTIPSFPDGACQNIELMNCSEGFGYQPNNREGYCAFDGKDDYIQLNYPVVISGTSTNLTIEAKCNIDDLSTDRFLFGLSDGTADQFYFYLGADGHVELATRIAGVFKNAVSTSGLLTSGVHTITGRICNGLPSCFIDGNEVTYRTQQLITSNKTFSQTLLFGTRNGSSCFKGKLYDFSIYTTAFSLPRIRANAKLSNDFGVRADNVLDTMHLSADSLSVHAFVKGPGAVACHPSSAVAVNGKCTLVAHPDSCAKFLGWSGDTVAMGDTLKFENLASNINVTATFEYTVFRIEIQASGGGRVDTLPKGKNGLFNYGELCTLIAVYESDSTVTWSGSGNGNGDTLIVAVDAQKKIIAQFSPMTTGMMQRMPTGGIPTRFDFSGNYPNPFRQSTTICFAVPALPHNSGSVSASNQWITLTIYNCRGQVVRSLINGSKVAGAHRIVFDGKNDKGQPVGNGIYFAVFKAGEYHKSVKITFAR